MDSIKLLSDISNQQNVTPDISKIIADVESVLDGGIEQMNLFLNDSVSGAPSPVDEIGLYILDSGGKRIRPIMCLLSARLFSSSARPIELASVCELMHNATLLHDDVIDEGDIRRGKDTSRKVWDNALSILGGDYILMHCMEIIASLPSPFLQSFIATLKSLVRGEIVQLKLRNSIHMTEAQYFEIVSGKTSSLFRFATGCGARAADASPAQVQLLEEFGYCVGTAFQLIDDVLDFSGEQELLGKDLFADISQGKCTLPLIRAQQEQPQISDLLGEILAERDVQDNATRISELISASDALQSVREEARGYSKRAVDALSGLESTPVANILKELTMFLLKRAS